MELGLAVDYPFHEVRCCRECNSALGRQALWTIESRKSYMKEWLKRRYQRYLDIPDWSDQELAQMGPTLEASIRQGLAVREVTKRRLAF